MKILFKAWIREILIQGKEHSKGGLTSGIIALVGLFVAVWALLRLPFLPITCAYTVIRHRNNPALKPLFDSLK